MYIEINTIDRTKFKIVNDEEGSSVFCSMSQILSLKDHIDVLLSCEGVA